MVKETLESEKTCNELNDAGSVGHEKRCKAIVP